MYSGYVIEDKELKDILIKEDNPDWDDLENEYEETVTLINQVCNEEDGRVMVDEYLRGADF